jgi:D-alanine transaminase
MQVWLDGRVMPVEEARISPFDRGFLFGDGVYEVVRFFDGVGMAMDLHLARLERSLALAGIVGFTAAEARQAMLAVLQAEGLRDAAVYLQVTRGAAATRTHIPPKGLRPTVFAFASACPPLSSLDAAAGISVVVRPDDRWHRCEIKTVSLMGSVLPMLEAAEIGAEEAILVREGLVSEGSSSNVMALVGDTLVTPPIDAEPSILHGTMRHLALDAAHAEGMKTSVRPLPVSELMQASEILIVSSRRVLAGVTRLDGRSFGDGSVGPVAHRLIRRMRDGVQSHLAAAR